jgi:hypothetical protein
MLSNARNDCYKLQRRLLKALSSMQQHRKSGHLVAVAWLTDCSLMVVGNPVLQGDTCNLLGALLQGQQLPTTLYTAM